MAFWDRAFERYRNANKNRKQSINPDKNDIQQQRTDKFGAQARYNNPNIEIFSNAQNNIADIVDKRSVVSQFQTHTQLTTQENYFSSLFSGIHALPILTNKTERIKQYRSMALYPECDFCLCELADDVIHEDETGEFIHLRISEEKTNLSDDRKKTIQNEFKRFMNLFNLREDAFNLVKRFLVEGEIAFENIINAEKPELGIIGVKYLPTEYYQSILNSENGKVIGISFDKENLNKDLKQIVSNSCLGARAIFNNIIATQSNIGNTNKDNLIPLLWPQVTYISSGETSPDGLISFPLIEKCKQAYHQLALLQDAAVILRVTRAPERLLFNISTGGMSDKVARQKIMQFINELKSKKIISSLNSQDGQKDITEVYNPVSMLETYFFGKSNANDGTTVESVGSTSDYDQIADIEFFLRRLFKQFKVPFSRYKTPENSLERDDTITYEEYSMARLIIRIQRRIALGLKRSFITDLKLRGIWKNYGLKEHDFNVEFVTPILYDLYQTQKLVTAKMDTYKAVVDQDELSKIDAMKRILRMSDEDIQQNFRNLIKEKMLIATAELYADQINENQAPIDYPSPLVMGKPDFGLQNDNDEENSEKTESGGESGEGDQTAEQPQENNEESGETEGGEEQSEEPSFGLG